MQDTTSSRTWLHNNTWGRSSYSSTDSHLPSLRERGMMIVEVLVLTVLLTWSIIMVARGLTDLIVR